MNEIAENASSNNTEGLAKAQAVLEALQQRTPDDADTGLATALEQLDRAQHRGPDATPSREPGTDHTGGTSVTDRVPGY